jgi:tripartite-type tricarboxylate transporter receptor subunit TctC
MPDCSDRYRIGEQMRRAAPVFHYHGGTSSHGEGDMSRTLLMVRGCAIGLLLIYVIGAWGQAYPTRPIRIVTGSVGGGSDFTARQIAQEIALPLGQPVIVENRASLVATETVAKAPPDGYTLLVGGASMWQTPIVDKRDYDPTSDFAPLSLVTREVFVLVVHPSLPVKSIRELVSLARARPAQLNISTGLSGGTTQLAAELFKSMSHVNMTAVPYKGTAPAIAALISGEVQVTINEAGLMAPHVKSGRVRALAVTSATPSALVPGLPTVSDSGVPGYEWIGMTHIMAPAKTPAPIIVRLNQEIVRALNKPDIRERYLNAGSEVVASSPETLADVIKADMAKIAKIIKEADIHAQ